MLCIGIMGARFETNPDLTPTPVKIDTCPKCGEANCIYLEIDNLITDGTDADISKAINQVARKIKLNEKQLEMIRKEYYQ